MNLDNMIRNVSSLSLKKIGMIRGNWENTYPQFQIVQHMKAESVDTSYGGFMIRRMNRLELNSIRIKM